MEFIGEFELWMFLAGLGIFLFGMHMMEESIRVLSGAAFKSMIRKYTGSRIKAILSGAFSTAVLQSSSAVSLMVLAFVGAGIMNLVQAISVMIGAKIGTTATAWIVAVFGFKFNIDTFSLPLIGIGGLGIILLAKSPKYVNISRFLVAFGFLFMGLDYMKSSVDQFSENIDPAIFEGYGIILFALAGVVMTAIMQSSSATIAIVLTMLYSGVIQFESGAAMVIGANVGTTVTVLLGSIGGIYTKKQAALSQLIFTVSTAVVALILLPVLIWIVLTGLGFSDNLVLGLALFHTLFNLLGVLIFYPLIPLLAQQVEKWISEKEVTLSRYIHQTNPEIVEAGIEAIRKEIIQQLKLSLGYIHNLMMPTSGKYSGVTYPALENYHAEIFEYYSQLHQHDITAAEHETLEIYLRASRNIMNASMNIRDVQQEVSILKTETTQIHRDVYQSILERIKLCVNTGKLFDYEREEIDSKELQDRVNELIRDINKIDRDIIADCGIASTGHSVKKSELTFLLMLNRLVTQSGRMIAHGMSALVNVSNNQEKKAE